MERPEETFLPASSEPEQGQRRAWPTPGRLLLAGLAAVIVFFGLVLLRRPFLDLVADTYRTATYIPINAPKAFAFAGLGLVFLAALPLAVLDAVSSARFRRAERDLRAAHPQAEVLPYEGPEGRGLLFDARTGRVLLLRPPGGLGRPRVVRPSPLPYPSPPVEQDSGR